MLPAALLLAACMPAADSAPGLRVPDGFTVTEFAGSDLANDLYCLTADTAGRVLVSGRGYLRTLIDDDGDGRADRAVPFADGPADGAMGLLCEGDSVFAVGGGGLWRYRDRDGDGKADGPPERLVPLKTGGEHDAHALRRGPDGWLYLLCGNSTGVGLALASGPASPVRNPVAGAVVRFSRDFKTSEVVAHGFRNPYGMDFNPDGELFTYDSDNERCVSLPWYEGTRFYHVLPGGHHGWQSPQRGQFFRWPQYFIDGIAPLADLGRGSPTGVLCYRHAQFPEGYRGGFFLADWTFGRVWFVPLTRAGSSYAAGKPEVFLQSSGDNGFAPTSLAVHPRTGDLFVSIGGRGTRGAVYRVRHPAGLATLDPAAVPRLQPAPRTLDPSPVRDLLREVQSPDLDAHRRALESLQRQRGELSPAQLREIARATWDTPDRPLRLALLPLLQALPDTDWAALSQEARTDWAKLTLAQALVPRDRAAALADALALVRDATRPADVRLAAARVAQLALGGLTARSAHGTVWEGYTLHQPHPGPASAVPGLASLLPSGHPDLDRELLRTLALVEADDPSLPARVAAFWTAASDPVDDLHALIVLARLRAPWPDGLAPRVVGALLVLDRKLTDRRATRDSNWPLRVSELVTELARRHPELPAALLAHKDFGRPDHALFIQAPGLDRRRAAELFLARAAADPDYAWNPDLVRLVATLPEGQSLPALRGLWDQGGLDEALLPVLARHPLPDERPRYVAGLRSPQMDTVHSCLDALEKLGGSPGGKETLALLRALRGLPTGKEADALRDRLARHLAKVTGRTDLAADIARWSAWFAQTYPDLAPRLEGADGVDVAAWRKRLADVDWITGDPARGRDVFYKASCAACHSGSQAAGPDLHGITGRFSREDLFTAILQPSRDISARYRPLAVTLRDGKGYQGLIIYEATDSLILQTGPSQTVRVPADRIESRRPADVSLMPAGLLDPLPDRSLADLYAYLRSLGGAK